MKGRYEEKCGREEWRIWETEERRRGEKENWRKKEKDGMENGRKWRKGERGKGRSRERRMGESEKENGAKGKRRAV